LIVTFELSDSPLQQQGATDSEHHQPNTVERYCLAASREAKQKIDNVYDGADYENHSADSEVM
jgi:hypothetical protein